MDGMVYRALISLLILIYLPDVTDSSIQCLTWEIDHEKLRFICRVPNFSHAVSLFDSIGKLYVKCTFDRYAQHCTPLLRNDSVVANFESNHVIFKTSGLHQDMNGEWICEQNNLRHTTYVSLSKGILQSTDVDIAGELITEKGKPKVKIKCVSCREPDGNNVEFLENNRSVDSLTFRQDTKTCTHQRGDCHPFDCSCSRNEFIFTFQYDTQNNGSMYSCDMLFTDSFRHEKYSKIATVFFNGTVFFMKNTITVIKKAADKIWNGTFTSNTGIEIDTGLDTAQTTPVHIPDDTSGGIQVITVIGIVIGCIAIFIFSLLLVRQHVRKVKTERTTTKGTGIPSNKDSKPLIPTYKVTEVEKEIDYQPLIGKRDVTDFAVQIDSMPPNEERDKTEVVVHKESLPQNGKRDMTDFAVQIDSMPPNGKRDMTDFAVQIDSMPPNEERDMTEVAVHKESMQQNEEFDMTEVAVHKESMQQNEKIVSKQHESKIVKNEYLCDPCKNQYKYRLAIFLCIDCEEPLCAICSHYHKVMKPTRKHNCVSINKIPRNFKLPLLCKDHDTVKYEYYCVDHELLCCLKCVTTFHSGKGCKVEVIDEVSTGFVKTQIFFDYEHQLNRYINLLVNLSTYQYHMIDQMADATICNFEKLSFDENNTDCKTTALKLNDYATETCDILLSTRGDLQLFEFMKSNGSERQLFILTNFLKQRLIDTDKRVLKLVENTKRAQKHYSDSQDDHGATFPSIEMTEKELMNISLIHRWRQSQTPVIGSRRK